MKSMRTKYKELSRVPAIHQLRYGKHVVLSADTEFLVSLAHQVDIKAEN